MVRLLVLTISHLLALAAGIGVGIFMLPILTAPSSPPSAALERQAGAAQYVGQFRRDLRGSDFLHWGEGQVFVGQEAVTLMGKIAPGPDYRLYLAPEFVDTEDGFLAVKDRSVQVGEVRSFDNFIVPVPGNVDVSRFEAVVIWCESFSQFITAAHYRPKE